MGIEQIKPAEISFDDLLIFYPELANSAPAKDLITCVLEGKVHRVENFSSKTIFAPAFRKHGLFALALAVAKEDFAMVQTLLKSPEVQYAINADHDHNLLWDAMSGKYAPTLMGYSPVDWDDAKFYLPTMTQANLDILNYILDNTKILDSIKSESEIVKLFEHAHADTIRRLLREERFREIIAKGFGAAALIRNAALCNDFNLIHRLVSDFPRIRDYRDEYGASIWHRIGNVDLLIEAIQQGLCEPTNLVDKEGLTVWHYLARDGFASHIECAINLNLFDHENLLEDHGFDIWHYFSMLEDDLYSSYSRIDDAQYRAMIECLVGGKFPIVGLEKLNLDPVITIINSMIKDIDSCSSAEELQQQISKDKLENKYFIALAALLNNTTVDDLATFYGQGLLYFIDQTLAKKIPTLSETPDSFEDQEVKDGYHYADYIHLGVALILSSDRVKSILLEPNGDRLAKTLDMLRFVYKLLPLQKDKDKCLDLTQELWMVIFTHIHDNPQPELVTACKKNLEWLLDPERAEKLAGWFPAKGDPEVIMDQLDRYGQLATFNSRRPQ